jgi:hypothetical protein
MTELIKIIIRIGVDHKLSHLREKPPKGSKKGAFLEISVKLSKKKGGQVKGGPAVVPNHGSSVFANRRR